ncbi:hypothetical protein KR044_002416 [Drosophila immigrans]|nr:hypothetical protein KR044_002416 [Drosophila immigrans]
MRSSKLLPLLLRFGILLVISAARADSCKNGMLYAAEAANEYYYCVNGVLHHKFCPGDDSYFDAQMSVCRIGKPSSSTTSPTSPSTSPSPSTPDDNVEVFGKCERIGQSGDLTDCNRFYHCDAKGAAVKRGNCPDGYIFDLVNFYCVRGSC